MRPFLPSWAPTGKGNNGSNLTVRRTVRQRPLLARTAVVHGEVLGVTLTFLVPDDEHVLRPDIVLGQEGRDLLVGMQVSLAPLGPVGINLSVDRIYADDIAARVR